MALNLTQYKFQPILLYSATIFVISLLLVLFSLHQNLTIQSYTSLALGVMSLLLIWHFGIKLPYIGLVSMERLVQFHILLTLPLFEVILINMIAGFIMPFINKNYRLDSYYVALLKGLSNAAMNALMMLAAGLLLLYFNVLPLEKLTLKSFIIIILIAIVIQVINMTMVALYHWIDKKNYKNLLSPMLLFADLIFVPIGVLCALLYQHSDQSLFYLFTLFVVLIMFSFNSIQEASNEQTQIFKKTKYISDYLDINSVSTVIFNRIDDMFSFEGLYLGTYNKDENQIAYYLNHQSNNSVKLPENKLIEISKLDNIHTETYQTSSNKIALLSSGFKNQDGDFAFICLQNNSIEAYTKADRSLLEMFVQRYSMGLSYAITYKNLSAYKNSLEDLVTKRTRDLEQANIEKTVLVEKLKLQAQRDGLTGLYNRRQLDDTLKNYKSKPKDLLFLAVLDIDFFKQVNDTYGHVIGDQVLIQLAYILTKFGCSKKEAFRYGGEEFVILLKEMNSNDVQEFLTTLLQYIREFNWQEIANGLKITVSIGLSSYPTSSIEDLFNHADNKLYKAKSYGRDQLVY